MLDTAESCGEITWALLAYGEGQVMLSSGGQPSDAARREVDLYIHMAHPRL